jgi:hypothetical protein
MRMDPGGMGRSRYIPFVYSSVRYPGPLGANDPVKNQCCTCGTSRFVWSFQRRPVCTTLVLVDVRLDASIASRCGESQ